MSRTVQFKRYANTTLANIVGASGELIVDTTNQTITIHDGVTPGGARVATESFAISNGGVGGGSGTDNVARETAQSAFVQANTASSNTIVLQGGLNTANANIILLFAINDSQNNNIQAAFDRANSANTLAQSAYDKANTGAIDTTARSVANSASSNTIALQGGLNTANANIALLIAVNASQNTLITAANTLAQGAYDRANSGLTTASFTQSGNTSAYATKRVLQYNESTGAVTYSNTLDAVKPYITGYGSEIHVSPVAFDDSGNGTIGDPVKTIARAQELAAAAFETTAAGSRKTIILHPGDYPENVTISTQYTVLTTHELVGKNTTLSGTLTITKGCTIDGLKMTNLVISADNTTGSVDIIGCTVTTSTTKTSSAYVNFRACDLSSSSLSITGAGSTVLVGGNYFTLTVNNASAGVLAKAVITMGPVTLTAGTLQLSDTLVYSATSTSNAITQSAGSVITLNNCQTLIPALTNVSRNSFGGFYSILHSVYDKANSTFGGTSLNSISYSQYINADSLTLSNIISTSNITGSLVVSGGAGIKGNVYSGDIFLTGSGTGITFVDGTKQTTNAAPFAYTQAAFDKANSANTLAQSAYNKANTGSGGSSSGYLPNAIIFANNAGYLSNSAALQFTAGSNTVTAQGPVVITNQTASTTNSTGALIVSGGVGVAENIYTGARVGYSSGGVSVAYTYYNSANNSLDTVFG